MTNNPSPMTQTLHVIQSVCTEGYPLPVIATSIDSGFIIAYTISSDDARNPLERIVVKELPEN